MRLFLIHRLPYDLSGNVARDSSNNSHCHPLVEDLPVLFCSLLQKVIHPLLSPFWSGFLAQSLLEIVKHPVHCLPCFWNCVCPDNDNGPLFSFVICSYRSWFRSFKLAVDNEIRCRLHFCRGNKTWRTPCAWSLCCCLWFIYNFRHIILSK